MYFGLITIQTHAQTKEIVPKTDQVVVQDTTMSQEAKIEITDSLFAESIIPEKTHNPGKATILSAIIPGLGQIYNKQIWKAPIIYGGLVGLGITIKWNQNRYLEYRQAYFDLNDGDATTISYNETLGFDVGDVDENNISTSLNTSVKSYVSGYSRQRNLMIITTVGFYLLNILDANVNAHFIDFDISEDLSFNFRSIAIDPLTNIPVPGVTFAFNF